METEQAKILGFFGEYRFLSNFHPSVVILDGQRYPTVEHAYQAAKTLDAEQRAHILQAPTPKEARQMGRSVTMRPDWEQVKVSVMEGLVGQKFGTNLYLRNKLLATGDAYLEETLYWHDNFWGNCTCGQPACRAPGANNLGKILMRVRDRVRILR